MEKMGEAAYLVGGTALVRSKHDDVRRGVGELLGVKGGIVLKELQVGTTAVKTVCVRVRIPKLPSPWRQNSL